MRWDRVIWNKGNEGDPVFAIKTLFRLPGGWRIRIHKFVQPDLEGCFHSHPAHAWRLILWGGYVEQTPDGKFHSWKPGSFGHIAPEFEHRIHRLINYKASYSLWIRGPMIRDVKTKGC